LLAFHGANRNPTATVKAAKALADRLCMIVVAPEFDRKRFSSASYQRGGIADKHHILDRSEWTINAVPLLVDWARRQEARRLDYFLIGHSGGGQYLSRVAAYLPTEAKRIVVANPSTHVFPRLDVKAPYGMGGLYPRRSADQELRRYLAQPVTIFLGQEDQGDTLLAHDSNAMAQGEKRYDRGLNAFHAGQQMAAAHRWAFGWRLVEVPGVGHNARKMYSSEQALEAMRP
jgi:hypothetical protein